MDIADVGDDMPSDGSVGNRKEKGKRGAENENALLKKKPKNENKEKEQRSAPSRRNQVRRLK